MRNIVVALVLLMMTVLPALGVQPDEILSDPKLEARARGLSAELRCLVCQNQSIDDSDAPLAKDLRVLVRDRLKEGDTDAQVIEYVVARYGEFVLLRPRFGTHTLVLWLAAPVVFFLAVFLLFRSARQRGVVAGVALSAAEQAKLKDILGGDGADSSGDGSGD